MIYIAIILALVYTFVFYKNCKPELSIWNKFCLSSLRFIVVFLLALMIVKPVIRYTSTEANKAKAIVLIDNSLSMDNEVKGKKKSNIVSEGLFSIKETLENNFSVTEYNFSSDLNGNTGYTDLVKTLESVNKQSDLVNSEIFLFSDGYYVNENLDFLNNYPSRINTFNFANGLKDETTSIISVRSNRNSYVGDRVPFEISIDNQESLGAEIEIRDKELVLDNSKISSNEKRVVKNLFATFKEEGLHSLEIVLKNGDNILDVEKRVIKVADSKAKILFITDQPNWDVKSIKDVLSTDKKFTYNVIVVKNSKLYNKQEQVQLRQSLEGINLLILSNQGSLKLTNEMREIINLKINRGLSLFLIGDNIQGLENISPLSTSNIDKEYEGNVLLASNRQQLSFFKDYLKMNTELPPIKYKYFNAKASASLLLKIDNMEQSPAVATMKINKSKILQIGLKNFWRWGSRSNYESYNTFISNTINWLLSDIGENFVVVSNKDGYFRGEQVNITSQILDEKGDLVNNRKLRINVYDKDSKEIFSDFMEKTNNGYSYSLEDFDAGQYTVEVTDTDLNESRKLEFIVFDSNQEQKQDDFNNSFLIQISKLTNGKNIDVSDSKVSKKFLNREEVISERPHEIKLLFNKWILGIFILMFSLELFFRKRWGLL